MQLSAHFQELLARRLPRGGFVGRPGGEYRVDATAWAVLALLEHGEAGSVIDTARRRVAGDQLRDGRVPVAADHPDAVWPTPLAVLAWQGSSTYQQNQARAVEFLFAHTASHPPFDPDGPMGHDTSIRGWLWVMETH